MLATRDPKLLKVRDVYDQTREGIDAASDVEAEFTNAAVFAFTEDTPAVTADEVFAFTIAANDVDA
jgi:hypothetical protein